MKCEAKAENYEVQQAAGGGGDSGRQKLSTNLYIQNVLACYATWPTVSRGSSSNEEELKQQLETRRNFKYKFNSHILCVTEMQRQQRQAAVAEAEAGSICRQSAK